MLGRLEFVTGKRGKGELTDLYGLSVWRVQTDPEGWRGERCLNRAGRGLRRNGAVRVLLPRGFDRWEMLKRFGLRAVDPAPFLRAHAPELALEGLRRQDVDPARSTVALAGVWADRAMEQAARRLCLGVRRLVIAAPGGERLAHCLREEFGMPVVPPGKEAQLELRFHPGTPAGAEMGMELFGFEPKLGGIVPGCSRLAREEQGDVALLCALWERGKLDTAHLKFT